MRWTMILCLLLAACTLDTGLKMVKGATQWSDNELPRARDRLLWEQKAKEGDPEAQYEMGKSYCCGTRNRFNNHAALFWYCHAGRQGQRDALMEIGRIYETANQIEGSIIPKDDVLAYVYYSKAAEHSKIGADAKAKALQTQLTVTQQNRAAVLLTQWPEIPCEVGDAEKKAVPQPKPIPGSAPEAPQEKPTNSPFSV